MIGTTRPESWEEALVLPDPAGGRAVPGCPRRRQGGKAAAAAAAVLAGAGPPPLYKGAGVGRDRHPCGPMASWCLPEPSQSMPVARPRWVSRPMGKFKGVWGGTESRVAGQVRFAHGPLEGREGWPGSCALGPGGSVPARV
ncbi:hypothetical protein HJG60_008871 [Phyllostomus discolor]|uniref:Uncharacterized protein n=1 Tax=Phyllostomus discolor TaxID=89673 RepID=A0A833YTJ2_9CHIR|nr:hypothetical protein HJG60_008871 [Phyllostomus discolor]